MPFGQRPRVLRSRIPSQSSATAPRRCRHDLGLKASGVLGYRHGPPGMWCRHCQPPRRLYDEFDHPLGRAVGRAEPGSCAAGGACKVGDAGPCGGVVFFDAATKQSWGRYLEVAPASWSGAPPGDVATWRRGDVATWRREDRLVPPVEGRGQHPFSQARTRWRHPGAVAVELIVEQSLCELRTVTVAGKRGPLHRPASFSG